MRLVRRILLTLTITLVVVFVSMNWAVPVALSFYAGHTALEITRVVPTELRDHSISQVPGTRLSYFGYEFEVPWIDLDGTQTRLYPTDRVDKTKVDLHFRSGLRLLVTAIPPRTWIKQFAENMNASTQAIETTFGESDYRCVKTLYEFSPNKMKHWSPSSAVQARESLLLVIKSIALPRSAETGIFNIQNETYKGFQQGNPQVRQNEIVVDLYSDEGSIELIFLQKDYRNSLGVTQSEINRIVQFLHKATQSPPQTSQTGSVVASTGN